MLARMGDEMQAINIWNDLDIKLIAILRGIKPDKTEPVITLLLEAGFRAIEIPLNSPDPLTSINIAVKTARDLIATPCLVGGGTVMTVQDVEDVHNAGGNLIVSPNANEDVIKATKNLNMLSAPGVYTPSECLHALASGADILKIFPAFGLGPTGIKAITAVLPQGVQLCAVGGIGNDDFKAYRDVGVNSFGLGSSLYTPAITNNKLSINAKFAIQFLNPISS